MKYQYLSLLCCLFTFYFSFAQNLEYSVLTIPKDLSDNANSVVRTYSHDIELESHKKMKIKVEKTVTVLNKLGNHESQLSIHYDRNRRISSLKAVVYDAFGKEQKKLSKNKFQDYSAADGISLHNDGRVKYYKHVPTSYPYTISYQYEVETSNTAFIPRWIPIDAFNQSIQNSSYTLRYPLSIDIQKTEKQFSNFTIDKDEKPGSVTYSIKKQPAIHYEEYSPKYIDLLPSVILAANKFHLEGYDGQANSWSEFGKWMYTNLIATRGELPESTKTTIKELVKGIDDPIERARKVYEFVQQKTRYISVQVGIGGWMPMLASDVDRLAYGDCKALTNYTKVLLDAADVESYYTAVHAGSSRKDMENEVVSVQGNHVFLYVPSEERDYWLECTSQTTPFGYQGSFTDDRDVLVIAPDGGKIVHTPAYDPKQSLQHTQAKYRIDASGNLTASVEITSEGLQYKNHYDLERQSEKDMKDYYQSSYWSHLNNLKLLKVDFKNDKRAVVFREKLEISATNYASQSADRMLLVLNALNRYENAPKRYRNRIHPVQISRGFYDKDDYEIELPEGYVIEALPESKTIENQFGRYTFGIEQIDSQHLKYTRELLLNKGDYPSEDYDSFRKFLRTVSRQDRAKLVLIKN